MCFIFGSVVNGSLVPTEKSERSSQEFVLNFSGEVAETAHRAVATTQKRFFSATYQVRPLMLAVAVSEPFSTPSTTNVVCLNVGIEMRVSLVVDFDPITADMAPGTIWHPYHVLSALCNITGLGRLFEIEI
jgi:hypothetical protein